MALSMRERLTLQKSVKQSLATLRGGEVGMRERLALQKQLKADMAKLGGSASAAEPQREHVTRDNTSVGDTVEWRNEMGTISGNFRGLTDDGRHAVIVHDGGMQSSAPIEEVFKASEEAAPTEPQPEPELSESENDPTPIQPSLTAQAVRGDFNSLALPEFIEQLKSAYSADEDLDGAKEAAIGYLEANQQELEAA